MIRHTTFWCFLILTLMTALSARAQVPNLVVQRQSVTVPHGGSVALGSILVNSTGSATLALRNTGSGPLTSITVTVDGTNASEVTITTTPATTVSPGSNTVVSFSFRPQALGPRTATLHIASNDPDQNPYDVVVTAEGGVPEILVEGPENTEVLDGGNLTFGTLTVGSSQTQTLTIKSTGTLPLIVSSAATAGPHDADFVVGSLPQFIVPVGASMPLTVTFAPKTRGSRIVELRIASTDQDENPYSIYMSGTANGSEITVEQPVGTNKMDGSSADFGTVAVGSASSLSFTIKNIGNLDLTGLSVTKDGSYAQDFIVTENPVAPVAPDGSTTLTVEFRPTASGVRFAALHIASNDGDESPFDLMLSGLAMGSELDVEAPSSVALADGSSRSFGSHSLQLGTVQTFTLKNTGNASLTNMAVTVDGTHAADFTVTQPQAAQVAAGSSTTIQVVFNPSAVGARTAVLHIASNDGDENPYDITLTGTGLAPDIRVERPDAVEILNGGAYDVGSLVVGQTVTRTLKIRNLGAGSLLKFGQMGDVGTHQSEFVATSFIGDMVPSDGTWWNWPITFTPTTPGEKTVTAFIRSNDPDEDPFEFTVTGTALQGELTVQQPLNTPVAPGETRNLGALPMGGEATTTFTIKNTGTSELTLTPSITGQNATDFSLVSIPVNPLPAGQSAELVVKYKPTSLGPRQANLRIAHDGSGPYQVFIALLTGTTVNSEFSFGSPRYTVNQGATKVEVVVKRTHAVSAMQVHLSGHVAAASKVPPLTPATDGIDVLLPSNQQLVFIAGEAEKTVEITLQPNTKYAKTNLHFQLSLAFPSLGAALGQQPTTNVRILGADSTKPTLTVTTPAAKDSQSLPMSVLGKAGDAMGIDRVEVKLNDEDPVEAVLFTAPPNTNTSVPFIANLSPADGLNEIVVTAYDLRGNSYSVTRSFTFTHRVMLRLSLKDSTNASVNASGGTVAMTVAPAAAASPLIPNNFVYPKTSAVLPGSPVKLVAKPAKGYVFSRWNSVSEPGPVLNAIGDTVTFTMPDAETTVQAEFMQTPFAPPAGGTTTVAALLRYQEEDGITSPFAMQGYLSGTMTDMGAFSGKLLMNGQSVSVVAMLYGDSPAVFTVAGQKRTSLPLPGGQLKLRLENNNDSSRPFRAVVVNAAGSDLFTALAHRAIYSNTKKVPASLLNSATKGTYTLSLLQPAPFTGDHDLAKHPAGNGYATATLTNTGLMTFTGMLADNTAVTASTPLLAGDLTHLFVQLPTPGGTAKGTLLVGSLFFDDESEVNQEKLAGDFFWYRPQAASPKVTLYPAGWPEGLSLSTIGGLYNPAITVQSTLGLATPTSGGNAMLIFSNGNLTGDVTVTNFRVDKNAVIKIPATDKSFTLTFNAPTGTFSGTFTPNWGTPATTLPAFKGVIQQVEGYRQGTGFFISNAKGETVSKSGSVLLSLPEQ